MNSSRVSLENSFEPIIYGITSVLKFLTKTLRLFILDPKITINQCKPTIKICMQENPSYIAHFLSLLSPLVKLTHFQCSFQP